MSLLEVSHSSTKTFYISSRLTHAMQKIDEINEEEAAYGWEMSQYPLRKQCADKLQPYKKLFDAGQEFMDKHELWMHTQVGTYVHLEVSSKTKPEQNDFCSPSGALLCTDKFLWLLSLVVRCHTFDPLSTLPSPRKLGSATHTKTS